MQFIYIFNKLNSSTKRGQLKLLVEEMKKCIDKKLMKRSEAVLNHFWVNKWQIWFEYRSHFSTLSGWIKFVLFCSWKYCGVRKKLVVETLRGHSTTKSVFAPFTKALKDTQTLLCPTEHFLEKGDQLFMNWFYRDYDASDKSIRSSDFLLKYNRTVCILCIPHCSYFVSRSWIMSEPSLNIYLTNWLRLKDQFNLYTYIFLDH